MKPFSKLITCICSLVLLCILGLSFSVNTLQAQPILQRQISFGAFGGKVVRFGDLTGDGIVDILTVQSDGQRITCVAAFDFNGNKLWHRGRPNQKNNTVSADLPVQVFDWDNDGRAEVILVRNQRIEILSGLSGRVIRSRKAPDKSAKDAIFIVPEQNNNSGAKFILKNRMSRFWGISSNLKILWARRTVTGHFPMAIDIEDDGSSEILVGYNLYNQFGSLIWRAPGLTIHNDAADFGDMDGDGRKEIAIATSSESVLLNDRGEILWRIPHTHSQHAVIGSFIHEEVGTMQAAFVDRGGKGTVHFINRDGLELASLPPQGALTMITGVDGWTGNVNEALLLVFRRGIGAPQLVNGKGEIVAEFPFPPAPPILTKRRRKRLGREKKTKNSDDQLSRSIVYPQVFTQHFDVIGDSREEIVVYDYQKLYLYSNGDLAPETVQLNRKVQNQRLYNSSFYSGSQ